MDLVVPGMDTATFLTHSDLQLSMHNGGYVLSKRLSRIMRPTRFWEFFAESEVAIRYNADLDGRLWDGSGQVSLAFVQKLADRLTLAPRHRRELLHSRRFEVTTLHAGGQDKGHVHVVENLTVDGVAVDFHFPAGSAKRELALTDPSARSTPLSRSGQRGRIFVGLQPVHSSNQMCLDIQSLINLHPFFQPEHLLAWSVMESGLFLDGIRTGRLAGLLNRLDGVEAPDDLAAFSECHVGEYIASGGRLIWFAGMVKAVGKQHLRRLGSREEKLRFPIPGGRYYIFRRNTMRSFGVQL